MKDVYLVSCCRTAIGSFGGSLKDTVYVLSDRFYTPVPETVCGSFDGLASGTEYTVKCFAVSAFALESEPLCLSFTLS